MIHARAPLARTVTQGGDTLRAPPARQHPPHPSPQITVNETQAALDHIDTFEAWLNATADAQAELPPHEPPVLTRAAIEGKLLPMRDFSSRLARTPRPATPTPRPKAANATAGGNATANATDGGAADANATATADEEEAPAGADAAEPEAGAEGEGAEGASAGAGDDAAPSADEL